ncbi:XRE family transcriptional regulator [Paludibacter sp. 221]|uniref:helix-turn-helix domain-containing protein n=1 Tax=Paludibacter sp. 221 TaxID=2302939 RepID=UPI0013D3C743|nr:helix-turn-helix transcriptional regulator [Paludibacter sp. 221]NDV45831.1 XRE family transcriptional regulator [Paludibacter sp. 221]
MFLTNKITELAENLISKDNSWNLEHIAAACGLSLSNFNYIRKGKSVPGIDKVERIARFFGVDMNYFFDYSEWKSIPISPTEEVNYMTKRLEELVRENERLKSEKS